MPNATDQKIRALIESFVSTLSEQVREAAVESVREAFGGGAARSPRPAGQTRREAGAGNTAPQVRSKRRKNGGKRDPEMVAALVERLAAFVSKNPGRRIEEIAPALGATTKELALPAKKLIAAKRITTKGQKRATTYHPR